ncbi:MAG: SDR family oxidoreductase [Nitrososphaeraceae archaeon]|jgi:NAD(P)-dependent dehydrogenase (short-subunit alcohol dehydrogenase family)
MSVSQKVAIVTGSSSGIGLETSVSLAQNGFLTYATMRNLDKSSIIKTAADNESLPIKVVQLNVADNRMVNNAIQAIVSEAGRIDILVNNAGYGLVGAFEDLSIDDEIKNQYETNVFGLMRVTQAVLPIMRRQKSGIIVNVSSGAGLFGYPGGSAYVSTKFAVEGLSESMAYELEPFGIKVVLIEPGFIKTNFANAMVLAKKAQDPSSPYSEMMQRIQANSNEMAKNASSVDVVSKAILEAVKSKSPNLRYLVGKDVEAWAANKKTMGDTEFHNMMQNLTR